MPALLAALLVVKGARARRSIAARVFAAWFLLGVTMTANGGIRELVLRVQMPRAADAISAGMGAIIILFVTRAVFRPFAGVPMPHLLQASALLVTLTVAFEFAVGRIVDRKSWAELIANYAFWRGQLWPFLLLLVSATPFIWGRPRRPGGSRAPRS